MVGDAREASGEVRTMITRKILYVQLLRFAIPVIKIA